MEKQIDYSQHFCKGEDIWKSFCFECQYPTEKDRNNYYLKHIRFLTNKVYELTKKNKLSFDENRAIQKIEELQKKLGNLEKERLYWRNRSIREKNKNIDIIHNLKGKVSAKLFNKLQRISWSASKKYDEERGGKR